MIENIQEKVWPTVVVSLQGWNVEAYIYCRSVKTMHKLHHVSDMCISLFNMFDFFSEKKGSEYHPVNM